jgi:hypothetical protein
MLKPPLERGLLVQLIKDLKRPRKFRLWCILKTVNVRSNHFTIHNEIPLPVQHIGDHEDLVVLRVGKVQGQLRGLDVKSTNARLGPEDEVRSRSQRHMSFCGCCCVPVATPHILVDGKAYMVRYVVFPQVLYSRHGILHTVSSLLNQCPLFAGSTACTTDTAIFTTATLPSTSEALSVIGRYVVDIGWRCMKAFVT